MDETRREPLTEPSFECFTVEMVPWTLDAAELGAQARAVLTEVLGARADDWEVSPVHPDEPASFDFVPPEPGALDVDEAWQLTYALQESPGVVDAEPSFEILQDNVGGTPADLAAAEDSLFAALATAAADEVDEDDFEWSPQLIRAPQAWELPSQGGHSRGEGILIGHPDSGFRRHGQIFDTEPSRFLAERGFDFVGRDAIAEDEDGGHGLGTASVIMSAGDTTAAEFVTGVAPAARIIPYRVAKRRPVVPIPILFRSGMRRLRQAVDRAVADGCHVISISLGWLQNRSLHRAIQRAVEAEVIVVAAAGNKVPFVVWPARYPEVVAVAGCTFQRRIWLGSSFGRQVAVSAPARNVWKATREGADQVVRQSDGTSYAAASTAGVAALWLAHWGRDRLLQTYGGEFRLSTVFRRLLVATVDPEPVGALGMFGAGIVNAERLLEQELPSLETLRASSSFAFEAAALAGEAPAATAGFNTVAAAFDSVPRPALRRELGGLLGIAQDDLDRRLQGVGRELTFHLLTTPEVREGLVRTAAAANVPMVVLAGEAALAAPAEATAALAGGLSGLALSDRLRSRLSG